MEDVVGRVVLQDDGRAVNTMIVQQVKVRNGAQNTVDNKAKSFIPNIRLSLVRTGD